MARCKFYKTCSEYDKDAAIPCDDKYGCGYRDSWSKGLVNLEEKWDKKRYMRILKNIQGYVTRLKSLLKSLTVLKALCAIVF